MHIAREVLLLFGKFNSVTQQCRKKLRPSASKADYFNSIILKFKTFIYNSTSKIRHIFCLWSQYSPVGRWECPHLGKRFFNIGIFRKNVSKDAKLLVELYVWWFKPNLHFFLFLTTTTTKINIENHLETSHKIVCKTIN